MPLHMAEPDLASGALVAIQVEDDPLDGHDVVMLAVHLTDTPLGPAGRWFVDRLKEDAAAPAKGNKSASTDSIGVIPVAKRNLDHPRLNPRASLNTIGDPRLAVAGSFLAEKRR
jgi:hypothetical protein